MDIELAKINRLDYIKTNRDNEERKPVEYNGNLFDFDKNSLERISGAIIALDLSGGEIVWTLADNTTTVVNANDLRNVIAIASVRCNQLHTHYRELKALIEQAETVEDVEKVVW